MKKFLALILVALMMIGANPIVFAEAASMAQTITIHVPRFLSISSPKQRIKLRFNKGKALKHARHHGHLAGLETNTDVVMYEVQSNGMSQSDGAGAVFAQLDNDFEGMDLQAKVGSFSNAGGNSELQSSSSGFTSIKGDSSNLASKANSSGGGKILKGRFPVSYKAIAKEGIKSGDHSRRLMLTISDV